MLSYCLPLVRFAYIYLLLAAKQQTGLKERTHSVKQFNRFSDITTKLRFVISCNSGDQNSEAILLHPSAHCELGFHYPNSVVCLCLVLGLFNNIFQVCGLYNFEV
jgi:hypothetical protein